jgi:hypothetical protein
MRRIEGFVRLATMDPRALPLIEAYRAKHGRWPSVSPVRCERCDRIILGSGIGIGAHRRAHRRGTA